MSKKFPQGLLTSPPILEREKYNKPLIEIIINALKGEKLHINNLIAYNYLLNQAIREYIILDDNWHLSHKAAKLWKDIAPERPITEYDYRQIIICNPNKKVKARVYSGGSNKGTEIIISKGMKLPYNDLFTTEHMTPVADIKEELKTIANPSYEVVREILDKIHICRITKEEDRNLPKKYKRGINYDKIRKKIYKNIPLVK